MSEYQYYEFAAIDGPISDEGLSYTRGWSSRAEVTRVRWQNTYHFGDFHGNVNTLLKHYDAHFYIANWGTVRLGLAIPKGVITSGVLQPYPRGGDRHEDALSVKEIDNRCIVWWERNEEGGWWDTGGEGLLDQLIGIRGELMLGYYRALFLGWLADFDPEDWRDPKDAAVFMPPIPASLNQLSPALKKLIEHFPVDPDALAVAATLSQASTVQRVPMAAVIEKLSASEMRALLARVAEGGGAGVMAELNRLTYPPAQSTVGQTISCVEFAVKALETRAVRLREDAAAAEAKRQHDVERRKQHLASVIRRVDSIWSDLDSLMDQQIASTYEKAATQLRELSDAYAQASDISAFQQKLRAFRVRYSNRPAMLRRIEQL